MAVPIVINLSNLTSALGFTIQGDAAGDFAGSTVSSAGDVNNDGIDDLIIGAATGNNGGVSAGQAYVIYGVGTATRTNIDLTNLTAAQGFIIQGDAEGDHAGCSVSSAGDVNKDGYDDLIVGAIGADSGGSNAGAAYVIYGASTASLVNVDLTNLAPAQGFILQGDKTDDWAGHSVSSAGDINKDGYDDVIVGAPYGDNGGKDAGAAYVIYGGTTRSRVNIDLSNLTTSQGFIIQGDAAGDNAGYSVSSAGDINKDGYDDLIIGAPLAGNRGHGSDDVGKAYVIYGGNAANLGNIDLTNVTQSQGFVLQGAAQHGWTGFNVASAGDVNNDGVGDLIVGAPSGSNGLSGAAYVVYGVGTATRADVDLTNLTLAQGFAIQGGPAGDAGYSVSSAGDINKDGYDDLIVGSPSFSSGGSFNIGGAFVIYGGSTATRQAIDLSNLTRAQGFVIRGDVASENAGVSVSSAGDINNDGYDDLLVGAPYGDHGGDNAGEAYVIYGGPRFSPLVLPSTATILARPGNSLTGTCAEFAMAAYLPTNPLAPDSLTKLKADGWTFLTKQTQSDFFNVTNLGYTVNADGVISKQNASAIVARSADALVLSITGTDAFPLEPLVNWPLLSAQLVLLQPLFQAVYDNALANGLKVIVTGHSLGAAMAQMFFAQFANQGVEIEGVNFASPGYASSVFEALATLNPIFGGVTNMLDYFNTLASSGHFHQYWNEFDPIKTAAFFQRTFGNKHDFEFSDQSSLGLTGTHDFELYLDIVRYVSIQHMANPFAGVPSIDAILRDYETIIVNANKVNMGGSTGTWIVGGATGPDTLEGSGALIPWNAKREALFGSFGSDVIKGYGKDDILFGAGDRDFLYGGGGRDILIGGAGYDVLEGGAGKDTMMGGAGGDRFVFAALSDSGTTVSTADLIVGFDATAGDRLDLRALGLVEFIGGLAFSGVGQVRIGLRGGYSTVEVNANDDTLPDMIILLDGLVSFNSTALLL